MKTIFSFIGYWKVFWVNGSIKTGKKINNKKMVKGGKGKAKGKASRTTQTSRS